MLSVSVRPFCLRVAKPAGLAQRAMSSTPPPFLELFDLLLDPIGLVVVYSMCFSGSEPLVPSMWVLGTACVAETPCASAPAYACSMV